MNNKYYPNNWMIALFASGYPVLIIGIFKLRNLSDTWATIIAGAIPIVVAIIIALRYKIK
ncbi:hypothetical protein ACFLV2_01100 [Chloroflexota bacterium]